MQPALKKTRFQLAKILHIKEKKARLKQLEIQMQAEGFWKNQAQASQISQEYAQLQAIINLWEKAKTFKDIKKLKRQALFEGEYDYANAICSVHAGAGGTEAQDWAQMVRNMLEQFALKMGLKTELLSQSKGEQAGIKSATFAVKGAKAYGWLKSEAGVHRLVRMSPFDADKARHTSFCLVEILPDIAREKKIEIPEKDLRIDTFRASGHGGQNVNKLETAVRVTHLPTNTVVSVQRERSQGRNKDLALAILRAKLYRRMLEEHKDKIDELRGERQDMAWGNQIRSYVLAPYQQVKDHRTGLVSLDPRAVLGGNLEKFSLEYLSHQKISESDDKLRLPQN